MDNEIVLGLSKDTFLKISAIIWLIAAIAKAIYEHIEDIKIHENNIIEKRMKILGEYIDVERIELEFRESEIVL